MGVEEQVLTQNLRTHVEQLAGEIGERKVFRPRALQAAASYIEDQSEQQGYDHSPPAGSPRNRSMRDSIILIRALFS